MVEEWLSGEQWWAQSHGALSGLGGGRRRVSEVKADFQRDPMLLRGQICNLMELAAFGGREFLQKWGVQAEGGGEWCLLKSNGSKGFQPEVLRR